MQPLVTAFLKLNTHLLFNKSARKGMICRQVCWALCTHIEQQAHRSAPPGRNGQVSRQHQSQLLPQTTSLLDLPHVSWELARPDYERACSWHVMLGCRLPSRQKKARPGSSRLLEYLTVHKTLPWASGISCRSSNKVTCEASL